MSTPVITPEVTRENGSTPSPETVLGDKKTSEQRKAILGQQLTLLIARGRRVESQSDYNAVVVHGHRPSTGLHLFLTIITLGLWGFVWLGLVLFGGEKREMVTVDEWGNSSVQKL
jgi:hypothetical protein